MEHLQEQFVRDWCSVQGLSYEKSLRWYNVETRACFPLEWSLKAWIFGFFRFLEIELYVVLIIFVTQIY